MHRKFFLFLKVKAHINIYKQKNEAKPKGSCSLYVNSGNKSENAFMFVNKCKKQK